MIPPAPGCSLISIGHSPHLGCEEGECLSVKALLIFLVGSFVIKMLSIWSVLPGTPGDCKREPQNKGDMQNRGRGAKLFAGEESAFVYCFFGGTGV
jgi:hypothetical protein